MDELNRLIHELREELGMSNEQKTIRVRIAVAVSAEGHVGVAGGTRGQARPAPWSDEINEGEALNSLDCGSTCPVAVRWVEADIPLPAAPTTIEGTVTQ